MSLAKAQRMAPSALWSSRHDGCRRFGNTATAVGSITFDDTTLPNPGVLTNVSAATLGVTGFSMTVIGASAGNGTFGRSSVTNWVWILSATAELHAGTRRTSGF
jgi:hypothetical protein